MQMVATWVAPTALDSELSLVALWVELLVDMSATLTVRRRVEHLAAPRDSLTAAPMVGNSAHMMVAMMVASRAQRLADSTVDCSAEL